MTSNIVEDVPVIVSFILVCSLLFTILICNICIHPREIILSLIVTVIQILVGHALFTLNLDWHHMFRVTDSSLVIELLVDLNSCNSLSHFMLPLHLVEWLDNMTLSTYAFELFIEELHQLLTSFLIIVDEIIGYVFIWMVVWLSCIVPMVEWYVICIVILTILTNAWLPRMQLARWFNLIAQKVAMVHKVLHAFNLSSTLIIAQQVLGRRLILDLIQSFLLRRDALKQAYLVHWLHLGKSNVIYFEMVIDVEVELV